MYQALSIAFFSVFIAFMGSPHCALMCGTLSRWVGTDLKSKVIPFHLGRLISYLVLGILFAVFSQVLSQAIQKGSLWGAGILTVLFFILFAKLFRIPLPAYFTTYFRLKIPPPQSAPLLAGMAAVFLPCGWFFGILLWLSTWSGAIGLVVYVLCFWIGTLPTFFLIQKLPTLSLSKKTQFTIGFTVLLFTLAIRFAQIPILNDYLNSVLFWSHNLMENLSGDRRPITPMICF